MFYIARFVISWVVWWVFADKKRWRELLPVGFFAGFIGSSIDNIVYQDQLWSFPGKSAVLTTVLDDFGINIVCTYLFIQWLPKKRTIWRMLGYWFVWTLVVLGVEWLHRVFGYIKYTRFWNLGWSYVSDWILFWLFYMYHKVFKFQKLNSCAKQK